jgi:oxygen-dependent protoporphyrinogen oxidase
MARTADAWQVEVEAEVDAETGTLASGTGTLAPETDTLEADAVVVATDERMARALLRASVPAIADDARATPDGESIAPEIEVVSLVVDTPALDVAPRGSGVLTVPGSYTAKALTHATAKWAWVAEAARALAPHRHVVRVSFGSQGEPAATADLTDAAAAALALAEASALLGVPLDATQLVDSHRERYTQSQPASVMGRQAQTAAVRDRVASVPGLGLVGAWVSGTGLAQVVPDAITEGERVRTALLWHRQP